MRVEGVIKIMAFAILTGVILMMSTGSADDDAWQRQWEARQKALEAVLGAADDKVLHSPVPFHLDGAADVLVFRKHNEGVVYVTADLIGDDRSKPNSLGQYELMICTPKDSDWAPQLISNLAKYTIVAVLNPNDTMDIGPALPKPSEVSAFLYLPYSKLEVEGKKSAVMLCLGITSAELKFIQNNDVEILVKALKKAGIYPMTDLSRSSVPLP
ncbi:suppressor of fused domain protein [Thalassoglobus sp. JC818]|uniref:suppressor of fused domain protein n=1 Tax=Thalassoglobus sp. JC818 TaxID=3232136 RepID=UPI00345A107B